jgi:hypothetical protein
VTAIIALLVAATFVFIRMSGKADPEQRLWRIAGEEAEAEMISRYLAGGEPIDADFDEEQLRKYTHLLESASSANAGGNPSPRRHPLPKEPAKPWRCNRHAR